MSRAYILPGEVRDTILTYLGNRPYREVASGVQALLDLKPVPVLDDSRELDEPELEP
jgi:hypothetical protein